jgi:hypothetical protein
MLNSEFLEKLQEEQNDSTYSELVIKRKLTAYMDIFSNRGLRIEKSYLHGLTTLLYALDQTLLANLISENLLWKKGILIEFSRDEYSFICGELRNIIDTNSDRIESNQLIA